METPPAYVVEQEKETKSNKGNVGHSIVAETDCGALSGKFRELMREKEKKILEDREQELGKKETSLQRKEMLHYKKTREFERRQQESNKTTRTSCHQI